LRIIAALRLQISQRVSSGRAVGLEDLQNDRPAGQAVGFRPMSEVSVNHGQPFAFSESWHTCNELNVIELSSDQHGIGSLVKHWRVSDAKNDMRKNSGKEFLLNFQAFWQSAILRPKELCPLCHALGLD